MTRYPLSWPEGWPRIAATYRQPGRFSKKVFARPDSSYRSNRDLTISDGVNRVLAELERMGIDHQDVIVSTNVPTRLDGLPRSGAAEPADPGVAVYWQEPNGTRRVIAIDQYTRVADNLAAIAATLDALRAVERHGGARILERAFTGFTALPPPGATARRTWRQVFGLYPNVTPSLDALATLYRKLAAEHHPDRGGSHGLMAELNVAYEEAKKEAAREDS